MRNARVKLTGLLPQYFRPETGDPLPEDLIGSTIVVFSGVAEGEENRPEGGGLVIDYIPEGTDKIKQVVFGFNELGMWIEKSK